jgi:hypothetical protein
MNMRRWVATTTAAAMLALMPAGAAWAESVTVQGTSDLPEGEATTLEKMVVNNRDGSVLLKIFGSGGKSEVRWVSAYVKDDDGTKYHAMGGWYGEDWAVSLGRGDGLVECDGFVFSWNGDEGYWKVVVPRDCLRRLDDRIKAKAEIVTPTSATPGYTPWSPWVKRG